MNYKNLIIKLAVAMMPLMTLNTQASGMNPDPMGTNASQNQSARMQEVSPLEKAMKECGVTRITRICSCCGADSEDIPLVHIPLVQFVSYINNQNLEMVYDKQNHTFMTKSWEKLITNEKRTVAWKESTFEAAWGTVVNFIANQQNKQSQLPSFLNKMARLMQIVGYRQRAAVFQDAEARFQQQEIVMKECGVTSVAIIGNVTLFNKHICSGKFFSYIDRYNVEMLYNEKDHIFVEKPQEGIYLEQLVTNEDRTGAWRESTFETWCSAFVNEAEQRK